jgi:hypothetical protein
MNNPIASIVETLQRRWFEATEANPEYKLIRWLVKPEELSVINAFYRLETSPYGSLPEFFVIMRTPFGASFSDFSRQLIADWTEIWEQDTFVAQLNADWHPRTWMEKAEDTEDAEEILAAMLTEFQRDVCGKDQTLVFGLLPHSVADVELYNFWIDDIAARLPAYVKLSFTDCIGENYLKDAFKRAGDRGITVECGDLNLQQAVRQMATAGEPDDPAVSFRKCLFEMADGAAAKDVSKINGWGRKAVLTAQKSGSKMLLATAYLVYGGFMMQLKKDDADGLLDKGLDIAMNDVKNGNSESVAVLLQLYGYKAAFQSIKGHNTKAAQWLMKQAYLALENGYNAYAISIFRMAARTSQKSGDSDIYFECLKSGYIAGNELSNDELRTSEISVLAYYYAEELRKEKMQEEATAIYERMNCVFGQGWEENVPSFSDKYAQTIPEITENPIAFLDNHHYKKQT